MLRRRFTYLACSLLAVMVLSTSVGAETPEEKYYRAYFLENEKGDHAAAAKLYAEVAASAAAGSELQQKARAREASCREEVATADFAALMQSNTLVYVELNSPGGQLAKLAEMLGVLRPDGQVAEGPRFAVSESLFREFLGIRGAALAITGFDASRQEPIGVLVMHPGDVDAVRGIIETALPAGASPVESIHGYPTFNIENEAYVTLTSRLVIASVQRASIENVVKRLKGMTNDSLAANPNMKQALGTRGDDLIHFCVNFKGILPLVEPMLAMAAQQSREAAMAQAVLDVRSLNSISGSVGVADEGLALDMALRLDAGHRNLAFNLLRMPAIDKETLKRVPAGSAGFVAAALNPPRPLYVAANTGADDDQPPPVSLFDIGREIFGNIVGVAGFVLPTEGEMIAGEHVPGAALVFSVNDSAKSEALWSQFLGLACAAAGTGGLEGQPVEIEGTSVRAFNMPEGITIYFTAAGKNVIVSPSRTAMAKSLATLRGGQSVLEDPAYVDGLGRLSENSTFAAFVHPRRCIEIARPHMHEHELREAEQFLPLLDKTVASFSIEHSGELFHISGLVSGVPRIGPMISKLVAQRTAYRDHEIRVAHEQHRQATADAHSATAGDIRPTVVKMATKPSLEDLAKVAATGNHDALASLAEHIEKTAGNDAKELNNLAWALLTEDPYQGKFNELALRWSVRSNELAEYGNWFFLDTLALARFVTGDVAKAVELQRKAVELSGGNAEAKQALTRYENALKQGHGGK